MVSHELSTDVCSFCADNIFNSARSWGLHHDSAGHLMSSADLKCIFCFNIRRELSERSPDFLTKASWPLYRWSVHRAARNRELAEVFSIVFSPFQASQQKPAHGNLGRRLREKVFHLYRENDLGRVPKRTDWGTSTNSPQSWKQVHKWIDNCNVNHPKCQRKTSEEPPLPTRLLDISDVGADGDQSGRIWLVNTKKHHVKGRYVTLSHSWGPNPTFTTVKAEDEEHMENTGITLSNPRFTQNFKEAILSARQLGINYIWIDSLCILQQNPEDFGREAHRMHIYYRNSFCNLAAADSKSPSQGLFRERAAENSSAPSIPARYVPNSGSKIFGDQSWWIVPGDMWQDEMLSEPLYKRGWVFQERMLAPRIIHFAKNQIFFDCATITACESMPDGLPRAIDTRAALDRHWRQRLQSSVSLSKAQLSGTEDLSLENFWRTAIGTYTRCELTNGKDKLVAVSGVAALVGAALDEGYGFGLWAHRLEEQLAWRVVDCKQANGSSSCRPMPLRYPSWSWVSIDAIVELQNRLPPLREYRVERHNGGALIFQPRVGAVEISVPHALLQAQGTSVQSQQQVESNTSPLEIKAYVGNGYIESDGGQDNWALHVGSRDPTRKSDDQRLIEAFPDEHPQHSFRACSFMVLSYSRIKITPTDNIARADETCDLGKREADISVMEAPQVQPPASFQGIGLIIDEISPDKFFRLGSFTFDNLPEVQLEELIPRERSRSDITPVRNIYLL